MNVAYLIMAWKPMNTARAIVQVASQKYPDSSKTAYIIRQKPFPPHLNHCFPFRIVEIDVPGKWPQLWFLKLEAFLSTAKEPITIWWDEDDRYEPDYTAKTIDALGDGHLAWTRQMRLYGESKFRLMEYPNPLATMVVNTETLRQVAAEVATDYPQRVRIVGKKGNYQIGPADLPLIERLEAHAPVIHHGMRTYQVHRDGGRHFRPAPAGIDISRATGGEPCIMP